MRSVRPNSLRLWSFVIAILGLMVMDGRMARAELQAPSQIDLFEAALDDPVERAVFALSHICSPSQEEGSEEEAGACPYCAGQQASLPIAHFTSSVARAPPRLVSPIPVLPLVQSTIGHHYAVRAPPVAV